MDLSQTLQKYAANMLAQSLQSVLPTVSIAPVGDGFEVAFQGRIERFPFMPGYSMEDFYENIRKFFTEVKPPASAPAGNPLPGEVNHHVQLCHQLAKNNGWWERERNIGETLMLVNTELAEAMEELRLPGATVHTVRDAEPNEKPEGFVYEIADAVIRLYDLAGGLGLNLGTAIARKLEFNTKRGYRHGGKQA